MLAAIGVAIGLVAAWAATRFIQAQLFGIQATDLVDHGRGRAGHRGRGGAVRLLPGRRATTIDPVRALRWE